MKYCAVAPSGLGFKFTRLWSLWPWLVVSLLANLPVSAQTPPNPAVELRFSEGPTGSGGNGDTTTNSGFLGGLATFIDPSSVNIYPAFTNEVPTGTYTPSGNLFALDMGPQTNSLLYPGDVLELQTEANPPGDGTLGALGPGLTVCGWLNSRGLNKYGDIAYALTGPGGTGFELGYVEYGALSLGINENFPQNNANASITQITSDPNLGNNNWLFFAATYDPTLSSNQVSYFFGKPDQLAYLDSSVTYVPSGGTTIDTTGPLFIGNLGDLEDNYEGTGYNTCQIFPGLIDELKVYTNAFTLAQVQQAQIDGNVALVAASILNQPANVSLPSGQIASFTVRATGSGTVNYTWYTSVNHGATWTLATAIGGGGTSFSLGSIALANSGEQVMVAVSNAVGGVVSTPATLTVTPSIPALVQLSFTEGAGTTTTNACAYFGNEKIVPNTPGFTNFVPVGPYAPSTNFNLYSLEVNLSTGGGGGRGVDIVTTNCLPPSTAPQNASEVEQPNWLGTFSAFTVTAWVNITSSTFRSAGGNGGLGSPILHCMDPLNNQPNGIEITYKLNGELFCGVNDDNNNAYLQGSMGSYGNHIFSVAPGSTGYQGVWGPDFTGANYDWVFFAVTWQGGETNGTPSVNFYFGSPTNAATLGTVSTIPTNQIGVAQYAITNTGQCTIGGFNADAGSSRTSTSGPMRGYIDEVYVFNRVLTLAEIQNVQVGGPLPPLMAITNSPNPTISWGTKSSPQRLVQLQSSTNLSPGTWVNVTNSPVVSGNTSTVTLTPTGAKFFRLQGE